MKYRFFASRQDRSKGLNSGRSLEFDPLANNSFVMPNVFRSLSLLVFLAAAANAQESVLERPQSESKQAAEGKNPLQPNADQASNTEPSGDVMREMQSESMRTQKSIYGHWGNQPEKFSVWVNHSNRLIPVYTFGITLDTLREKGSVYGSKDRLGKLYGSVPKGTFQPSARYYDQADLYQLQVDAYDAGFQNIILMVFDGMDWQTAKAASLYKQRRDTYESGRGSGLAFQDERRTVTDFGLVCTSAYSGGAKTDVNSQTIISGEDKTTGGYDPTRGGIAPWHETADRDYLMGIDREQPHTVTDSAASATGMTTGMKTYNGGINVDPDGNQLVPLPRQLQEDHEVLVGVVTSVPVSHATPATAYANNVSRKDYQDISRDLLGLPSISHRSEPLRGVDVLIGGGFGSSEKQDKLQGENFASGNKYLHEEDLRQADIENGGKYFIATRTEGKSGKKVLQEAAQRAADEDGRLLGYFGVSGGHLPFRTANGDYKPTLDVQGTEKYSEADLFENPTLADMTTSALTVLEQGIDGFWLMIEAGDIDWANHANNLDNSIGATLSGEAAFIRVMDWIDENHAWDVTAVIVTADHGHYLVIDDPQRIADAGQ